MKKCLLMFVLFVLSLVLAAVTDGNEKIVVNEQMVESELARENQPTNEIVLDDVLQK